MVNYWVIKITKGGEIPFYLNGKLYHSEVKEGYQKYLKRKYAQGFVEEYKKYGIESEIVPQDEVTGKEEFNNVKKQIK